MDGEAVSSTRNAKPSKNGLAEQLIILSMILSAFHVYQSYLSSTLEFQNKSIGALPEKLQVNQLITKQALAFPFLN